MQLLLTALYSTSIYIGIALLLSALIFKWYCTRAIVYRCALTAELIHAGKKVSTWRNWFLYGLRVSALLLLIGASGRLQYPDPRSRILVDGLDIVLVLDVSGSMQYIDNPRDHASRIDIAKREAIRFIEKRQRDAIGLVIFGKDALSRCPITADKGIVKDLIQNLTLGIVDPDGTVLSMGIVTGVNRLRRSKAKSKIMIVLTDGEPSEQDIDPHIAIQAAQQCGVKIYTIGIGSEDSSYQMHPLFGMIQTPKINKELLTMIATQTGGQFFLARNAQDMGAIYDVIDQLETTEHEVPQFSRYFDLFIPFIVSALILIGLELILRSTIWFCL